MTDLWDKLCAELSKAIWEHPRSYVATRFDRVKAEGDRLKDELETAEAQINLLKIDVGALDKENKILQSIGE